MVENSFLNPSSKKPFIQYLKLVNKTLFTRANSLEHKGKFNRPSNMAMILYKQLVL